MSDRVTELENMLRLVLDTQDAVISAADRAAAEGVYKAARLLLTQPVPTHKMMSRILACKTSGVPVPYPDSVWDMMVAPTKATQDDGTSFNTIDPWFDVGHSRFALQSHGDDAKTVFVDGITLDNLFGHERSITLAFLWQDLEKRIGGAIYPNCRCDERPMLVSGQSGVWVTFHHGPPHAMGFEAVPE